MEKSYGKELNMKDTELRLGLPGSDIEEEKRSSSTCSIVRSNKRSSPEPSCEDQDSTMSNTYSNNSDARIHDQETVDAPPAKVQVVGWPPIRSYRKNSLQQEKIKSEESGMYVKVSMAGAPFLRKIDLMVYSSYPELLKALENMFKCTFGEYSEREGYDGSEYVPTYEDKDGDWMLVGDVPWKMFMCSCKRLRIMKGSEAKGLGCL